MGTLVLAEVPGGETEFQVPGQVTPKSCSVIWGSNTQRRNVSRETHEGELPATRSMSLKRDCPLLHLGFTCEPRSRGVSSEADAGGPPPNPGRVEMAEARAPHNLPHQGFRW